MINPSIERIIDRTNGRFFSVQFNKINGEFRSMNCKVIRKEQGNYYLVQTNRGEYRRVNRNEIHSVYADGIAVYNLK